MVDITDEYMRSKDRAYHLIILPTLYGYFYDYTLQPDDPVTGVTTSYGRLSQA